jgi:hypothetical protein
MPPVGAQGRCLSGFPHGFPYSIGIELQPAGVDRRWVRLWLLDRSGAPSSRCRLVARSAALRWAWELHRRPMARGRCVGVSTRSGKAHQATQVWGRGAVGRGCTDRAVAGSGQALPAGIADHRSRFGPFLHSRWNPFQRL